MNFTICDTVIARCFAHPGQVALELVGRDVRMTYGEVWRRIFALSQAVSGCRDGKHGKIVGLLLPNHPDAALALAACQHAGVVAVPVNGRLTVAEMQFILDDADVGLLLTGGSFKKMAHEACQGRDTLVTEVENIDTPAEVPRPEPRTEEIGNRAAVIGYTSGTTGFPKGAIYTHDYYSMNNYRWGWVFGMTYDHVMLIAGPMFHLSYAGFALAGLSAGMRVRIMDHFDPTTAMQELKDQSTFAFLVPSMLSMIADHWEEHGRPPLNAARHVVSAGAPASLDLIRKAMKMFPNAKIAEMYGWTEGTFATYEIKTPENLEPNCVGWPALGADVAVFAEDGSVCGVGQEGEVGVCSGVSFAGYLGNPEATAQAHHRGYIMSGDIGRWLPDGRLCIVDRKKDVVISGGENVYTAEVERVLLEHPEVMEAAVVGLPDETWGEVVTALVVRTPGSQASNTQIIGFCRERMAAYKSPRRIEFADELPRNSMGKVQKFKIVEGLGE